MKRKIERKPDRKVPVPDVMMNRTTRQKLLKAIAEPQRTPGAVVRTAPAPSSGHQIVFTGLEHVEAGKSIGRFCVCTSDPTCNNGFFINTKGTEAFCEKCRETHPLVDFKTAVSDGSIDLSEAVFCIGPRELIGNLLGQLAPASRPDAPRKAATS